jgi:hypothetical protein
MKKFIIVVILVIVGIFAVLGIIAPREYVVEKSLVINRPSTVVFESIKHIKSHSSWNPRTRKDPNIKFEYAGVDGTVGFITRWKGTEDVGSGEQEIKNIVEGKRIDIELRFKEPVEAVNESYLITKDLYENQTQVTWGMKVNLKFPGNIFSYLLNMPKKQGYDFDEGLRILKAILEKELDEGKNSPMEELKQQLKKEIKAEKDLNQPAE